MKHLSGLPVVHERMFALFIFLFVEIPITQALSNLPWTNRFSLRQQRSHFNPTSNNGNIKVLILPGFGNDISDYYLTKAPQGSLVRSFQQRNVTHVQVLQVQRTDWLQVFWRGAMDWQFWTGVAPPTRPAFSWYLDRTVQTILEMTNNNDNRDNSKVLLVCHSAGGWLARAALGYGHNDNNQLLSRVCGIVTLGSPNCSPPDSVMDMTRGALKRTCQDFPGAFHHKDLFYVTVIGKAVQGVFQERSSPLEPTSVSGFAYNSYKAVCGDGCAVGDGVVPCVSAHLEGATQLDLDGIFHSINVPDQWYGSDAVIDSWFDIVLGQIRQQQRPSTSNSFVDFLESLYIQGSTARNESVERTAIM